MLRVTPLYKDGDPQVSGSKMGIKDKWKRTSKIFINEKQDKEAVPEATEEVKSTEQAEVEPTEQAEGVTAAAEPTEAYLKPHQNLKPPHLP